MRQVYLKPGDYLIDEVDVGLVSTILGSCVAVILWHPKSKAYCICHYLLAGESGDSGGRYGHWILNEFRRWAVGHGFKPEDVEAMITGGAGSMQASLLAERFQVGSCNYHLAQQFISEAGFYLRQEDVGGNSGRKVIFNPPSGKLTIQLLSGV